MTALEVWVPWVSPVVAAAWLSQRFARVVGTLQLPLMLPSQLAWRVKLLGQSVSEPPTGQAKVGVKVGETVQVPTTSQLLPAVPRGTLRYITEHQQLLGSVAPFQADIQVTFSVPASPEGPPVRA